jgi:hypothetical protein
VVLLVPLAAGLVQDGVGPDEIEDGAEVPPQSYGYGWDALGQGWGVWDGDFAFGGGAREPLLEGLPRCEIRRCGLALGEGGEDVPGLLAGVASRGLASVDGRAFVQELLPRSFLHATLELQSSETPHPQGLLATILPRSGRLPRSAPRW